MSDVGTLKELDVNPGDVVECVEGYNYAYTGEKYTVNAEYEINGRKIENINLSLFRIISRANALKLWLDMTDAEKGALLLAHNEGKVIEFKNDTDTPYWIAAVPRFASWCYYRVSPEQKIEVVTMDGADIRFSGFIKGHRITFNTVDGKPDTASIKMEAI